MKSTVKRFRSLGTSTSAPSRAAEKTQLMPVSRNASRNADAGEPLRTIFDDMVDQCGSGDRHGVCQAESEAIQVTALGDTPPPQQVRFAAGAAAGCNAADITCGGWLVCYRANWWNPLVAADGRGRAKTPAIVFV